MSDAGEQIKILDGEEAKREFSDAALAHLTNRANKLEKSDMVGHICHRVTSSMYGLLGNRAMIHAVQQKIDPAFRPIEHMKSLRDRGDIAIAKDGENTVGMVGFEFLCTDPNSDRKIYEIRRLAVRKKYEGRFISLRLYRAIMRRLEEIDPDALILVEAQNPAVAKQCQRMGYTPHEALDVLRMKYGEDRAQEMLPWFQQSGGQFLFYDPKAISPHTSEGGERKQ